MIQFLSKDCWKTIHKLSKQSRRTKVAVAFFGKGAARQLPLKRGDTLLVAMTLANVQAGQVCPDDIQQLFNKGVHIYVLEGLHAKVYLFTGKVVVGSANVSSRSANYLLESAILTNDAAILRNAERFIDHHCIVTVDQPYIDLCQKLYRPPKFPVRSERQHPKQASGKVPRVWVISTKATEFDVEDNATVARHQSHFDKVLAGKHGVKSNTIRYRINHRFVRNVQKGDRVIQLYREGKETHAYAPAVIMGVRKSLKRRRAYIWIKESTDPRKRSWTNFERYLRRNRVTNIKKISTRLITNEDTKRILMLGFK